MKFIFEDIVVCLIVLVNDEGVRDLFYWFMFIVGYFSFEDVVVVVLVNFEIVCLVEWIYKFIGLWV